MRTDSRGFTLIELLIVVVVIGVLAAIAVSRYDNVRTRAFISAAQSDLKNISTKQEMYHADNLTYANDVALLDHILSRGVSVTITHATGTGWSATATHSGDSDIACGVFVGDAPPAGGAPATLSEVIACTP